MAYIMEQMKSVRQQGELEEGGYTWDWTHVSQGELTGAGSLAVCL